MRLYWRVWAQAQHGMGTQHPVVGSSYVMRVTLGSARRGSVVSSQSMACGGGGTSGVGASGRSTRRRVGAKARPSSRGPVNTPRGRDEVALDERRRTRASAWATPRVETIEVFTGSAGPSPSSLCRRDVCRSTRSRGGVFGRLEARRTRVGAESEWSIELRSFCCGMWHAIANRRIRAISRVLSARVSGTGPRHTAEGRFARPTRVRDNVQHDF